MAAEQRQSAVRRSQRSRRRFVVTEIALLGSLYGLYTLARNMRSQDLDQANAFAHQLVSVERLFALAFEPQVNHWVDARIWIAVPLCFWYASLHYLVTPTVLILVARKRPDLYGSARTSIVLATLVALVMYWTLPTTPPRLLGVNSYVDTMEHYAGYGWWGAHASAPGPAAWTNEYAAFPSMHAGWSDLGGHPADPPLSPPVAGGPGLALLPRHVVRRHRHRQPLHDRHPGRRAHRGGDAPGQHAPLLAPAHVGQRLTGRAHRPASSGVGHRRAARSTCRVAWARWTFGGRVDASWTASSTTSRRRITRRGGHRRSIGRVSAAAGPPDPGSAFGSVRCGRPPSAYVARTSFLSNLPTEVRGTASTNAHRSGTCQRATRCPSHAQSTAASASSEPLRVSGAAPRTTTASGRSPQRSSGTPTTAASATSGCPMRVFSRSTEEIHSPPDLMTSLARSVRVR